MPLNAHTSFPAFQKEILHILVCMRHEYFLRHWLPLCYLFAQLYNDMALMCISAKGRRQPKAAKPKKMIRLESQNIVYAACNNGSSAVITKEGGLYMFGKDTAHCHQGSGR